MIKKHIALILFTAFLTFCLVACGNTGEAEQEQSTQIEDLIEYVLENRFQTGKQESDYWEDLEEYPHVYKGDAIPDAETAMRVASVLVEIARKQGLHESFELSADFYDTEKCAWVVSFARTDLPEDTFSSCYNIALDKKTGEVIKMWPD